MKYLVILCDGMSDYPIPELDGKTPMEAAFKPNMDRLARVSELGLVHTLPQPLPCGSDTANLSILGYDPAVYYSGRSPLEAVSMGIDLLPDDVTYRCNLLTLSDAERLEDRIMVDHSADEITTAESAVLVADLKKHIEREGVKLYAGVSYRHCLVLAHAADGAQLTPPHDIPGKCVAEYLPKGTNAALLTELTRLSYDFLSKHPVNLERVKRGLRPANSVWFWGEGRKPRLDNFYDKFGLHGAVISAVDLIKGIGICAGMRVPDVEGATGNINTNFAGKAQAAIDALSNGCDFCYIHVEAPDECGHRGELQNKIKAVERIDKEVLAPLLDAFGDGISILVTPDHSTPLSVRTHTRDYIPFMIYRGGITAKGCESYCERTAAQTGLKIDKGYTLMNRFLQKQL